MNTVLKWLSKAKSGYLDYSFVAAIMRKGSLITSKGGPELSPVLGHLGGREQMVKPTWRWVGFVFSKKILAFFTQSWSNR